MEINKLLLLGFEEGSIAHLIETAEETYKSSKFDIILNTDINTSDAIIGSSSSTHSIFRAKDYSFKESESIPVHFGVLHSHIKYVLYHYFFEHHNIQRERYISFQHPLSYIPESSVFDHGFYLGQLSAVSSHNFFGFGVTIKKSCSIGHHSHFGDFVTVNPGAVVAGYTSVGEGTEIGTGTTVSNNISIGKQCLIGAGSVVTKDIPDGVIAYGNPCRVIRKNERWGKAMKLISQF